MSSVQYKANIIFFNKLNDIKLSSRPDNKSLLNMCLHKENIPVKVYLTQTLIKWNEQQ